MSRAFKVKALKRTTPNAIQQHSPTDPHEGQIMRTLQTQEIKSVAGAGILTSTLSTGFQAGSALLKGVATAGTLVAKPLVNVGVKVIKILI
jgi:hypothetical protein